MKQQTKTTKSTPSSPSPSSSSTTKKSTASSSTTSFFLLISLFLIIFCFGSALYFNTLSNDYVYDDSSAVKYNADVKTSTPIANVFQNDWWGRDLQGEFTHTQFRPVVVLSYRLNYAFVSPIQILKFVFFDIFFFLLFDFFFLSFCSKGWIQRLGLSFSELCYPRSGILSCFLDFLCLHL